MLIRPIPFFIFIVLVGLTVIVWGHEVDSRRGMLSRHTEDVCMQASERLNARIESCLKTADIFARRWATHETRDFSHVRFREFASVLLREIRDYHSIRIILEGDASEWMVPKGAHSAWNELGDKRRPLLAKSRSEEGVVLLPFACGNGSKCLLLVLPLLRGNEFIGNLVFEFRSDKLIKESFPPRILTEFNIKVEDDGFPLFSYSSDDGDPFKNPSVVARNAFRIQESTWRVTMVPNRKHLASAGRSAGLPVLFLGLILSTCLGLVVYLLSGRMEMYRDAHARAVSEMQERERTQKELQSSEARYRSVFNSATDGLLVLDDDHRIVEANPAAAAMHGYSRAELVGRRYPDIVSPGHRHLFDGVKRQVVISGPKRLDAVHLTSDGKPLDLEVRLTSLYFEGEPRLLAILTDVSERKRALERHALLSRKILVAQEEERARVSRDLHDELGQILTALHLEIDMLRKKAPEEPARRSGVFDNAVAMIEKAAEELRHICRGLRPPLLDDLGIEPAVGLLVEDFSQRTGIETVLAVNLNDDEEQIPVEVALCTYRILQESLRNIAKHANASEVDISLKTKESDLLLSVYDNGRGFDSYERNNTNGFGITGMRERARLVNGTVDILSELSRGTQLIFRAPLSQPIKEKSRDQDYRS